MKYFVSYNFVNHFGVSTYSTIIETDYKIDCEENLYKFQKTLGKLHTNNKDGWFVVLLNFKEL